MNGTGRFAVFMLVAVVVFITVLLFVMRKRVHGPDRKLLALTTFVVVVLGMLFARYGYIFFRPPWWIGYGVPALVTFLMPPAVLHMKRDEVLQYVPLAVLMAPAIHVFFSLFIGWHDYMPSFPFYVPSLADLVQRIR
jgi:hypothetical protein